MTAFSTVYIRRHNRLGPRVDFAPKRVHDFARVESGVSAFPSQPNRVIHPYDVSRVVERVLYRYVCTEYFGLGSISGKMVATAESGGASGEATVATERDAQLWKSTIAAKLAHLPVGHRKALEKVARLSVAIDECRRQERELEFILSSPSARQKMRRWIPQVRDLLSVTSGIGACFQRDRDRTASGVIYREAALMFWHVIHESDEIAEYCLGGKG